MFLGVIVAVVIGVIAYAIHDNWQWRRHMTKIEDLRQRVGEGLRRAGVINHRDVVINKPDALSDRRMFLLTEYYFEIEFLQEEIWWPFRWKLVKMTILILRKGCRFLKERGHLD